MAEKQPSKSETQKRERQPISIPFIWEEKPGTPKKDWKPTARQTNPRPLPVKLVVSVPFGWEEKPGTPLQSVIQPPNKHDVIFPPSPPKMYSEHDYKNCDDQFENEQDGLSSDSESDTCSFKTVNSFSSARSTGSLVGASFLEWLFPLLATNSKFGDKEGCLEKGPSRKEDMRDKELLHESSRVRRPLLTLGELIVMSRRRSCQRKVNRMHKQPSMAFMKRNAWDCFIFGSGNGFRGLQMKWKRQLQLKLM